ncbi:C-C motif chemokine 4 [Antrostomus carolinensis]|uniref:C-C motif chemokine 4 n=1 Tax=Antrostomus carolinensis TaxID=279965 RepID=A0A094LJD4_ANTCR|nr:C-C motif chemokine 4 [Antrostomus carolinensis]KFZ63999.1 C-C motif chemokine 4 [Antrostomus carolinensis]
MKVPVATLAALFLLAICTSAEAQFDDSDNIPTKCCFSYMRHPIPRSLITSAYTTSSLCSQPAVILVTRKGRQLCVEPQAPWVQEYLKHFQMLKN